MSKNKKYEVPYLKELKPDPSLTKIDEAFPASVLQLMPRYEDIPEEFKLGNTKWNKLQHDAFFSGVKDLEFDVVEGIDPGHAL